MTRKAAALPALLALCLFAPLAAAQPIASSAPTAAPLPPALPAAADVPYPGTMTLDIDATDTLRGLYRVTQVIPVATGARRLTLLLPQWHPGKHGPRGTMAELADLTFTSGTRTLRWTRDPVDVFAFHIDLPEGTTAVTARFIHTSPLQPSEGRVTMSAELLNLQWNLMSLYPAGHYVRQIRVKPSVTCPANWTAFTALDGAQEAPSAGGRRITWAETDYDTLVDSPVFAGINAARFDLGNQVSLDVVADDAKYLAATPADLAPWRALVAEALALYGGRHFDHYDILLSLTDKIGDIGLEHLRSSENSMNPTALIDQVGMAWDRNVIPHEISHSWDGKYRRPAGLWTPDFRTPMQNNLLWVYEGQNQLWGYVLAARSGVQPKDVVLGMIASAAGNLSEMPGRAWRPVEDTTHDPIFAARKPKPFASLTRGEDYYTEGALTWLEADQLIREGTRGRKGLDDFAAAFFGQRGGDLGVLTYTFDDIVAGLNAVYPNDWATFLRTRLQEPGRPAPLAGIEKGGYRLVWREEPNPYDRGRFADGRLLSLTFSLGLTIDKDAKVTASQWGGPAFAAGIVPGARIVAVNGAAYTADVIRAAITAARTAKTPLQLLVLRAERYQTIALDYHGGLRYPWLERKSSAGTAGLDLLLSPKRTGP